MDCEIMRYVVNSEIIPLYLDSAKTFMNLSSGAIGLTVVFREKIIGSQPGSRLSLPLMASWLFFLGCIGASAFYQYLGVKFLDSISCEPGKIQYFASLVSSPGKVYGVMLILFVLGAISLVVSSWHQLRRQHG
jgi:hypothetical protein